MKVLARRRSIRLAFEVGILKNVAGLTGVTLKTVPGCSEQAKSDYINETRSATATTAFGAAGG
jgi:hypothetical protein